MSVTAVNQEYIEIRIPVQEYYTVQTAARILGISSGTVYHRIKQGTIKAVEIEGTIHVSHEVVYEELLGKDAIEELESPSPVDPSEAVEILPEADSGRKTPMDFLK